MDNRLISKKKKKKIIEINVLNELKQMNTCTKRNDPFDMSVVTNCKMS
ncbi:unnamed protein product [Brugia timori]|uniref:Uncharacterized protein n=1 Tax=Brugia timori TaxID=42155 RepID=A0A0R3QIU5_9BILA|nr:unnamed protein product [Brugia timori]